MSLRSGPCWVVALMVLASGGAAFAGDGAVALQTADPSCGGDSTNRYVDCGNGTVTDNQTGLVWLANADCFGSIPWHEAMDAVAGLADLPNPSRLWLSACGPFVEPDNCDCGLSDGSSPGEWRLASLTEWQAMIKVADRMNCNPAITTDLGDACWTAGCHDGCNPQCVCSFYDVQSSYYWSSTLYVLNPQQAWITQIYNGDTTNYNKNADAYVWPVRGGQ